MPHTITFTTSIAKSRSVIHNAVREGLQVFETMGHITNIGETDKAYIYTAMLNTPAVCKCITEALIMISVLTSKNDNSYIEIKAIMSYERNYNSISSLLTPQFLVQLQLKSVGQKYLYGFKKRVEKWG